MISCLWPVCCLQLSSICGVVERVGSCKLSRLLTECLAGGLIFFLSDAKVWCANLCTEKQELSWIRSNSLPIHAVITMPFSTELLSGCWNNYFHVVFEFIFFPADSLLFSTRSKLYMTFIEACWFLLQINPWFSEQECTQSCRDKVFDVFVMYLFVHNSTLAVSTKWERIWSLNLKTTCNLVLQQNEFVLHSSDRKLSLTIFMSDECSATSSERTKRQKWDFKGFIFFFLDHCWPLSWVMFNFCFNKDTANTEKQFTLCVLMVYYWSTLLLQKPPSST